MAFVVALSCAQHEKIIFNSIMLKNFIDKKTCDKKTYSVQNVVLSKKKIISITIDFYSLNDK